MGLPQGAGTKSQQKQLGWEQAERMCKLAVGRVYGLTRKEIAVLLGTTDNQVRKWITEHREFIDAFEAFVKRVMPDPAGPAVDIADKEQYIEAALKKLGLMLPVFDRALASHDLKLAMDAGKELHKVLGMTQT